MDITTVCTVKECENFGVVLELSLPTNFSADVWCVCGNLTEVKEANNG
jgi:hypothetical protein